jgi:hypothetical protein
VTQDEIIRMAREACSPHQVLNTDLVFLERFAALVSAHEREVCAKVCDDLYKHDRKSSGYDEGWNAALDIAEQAIRGMK